MRMVLRAGVGGGVGLVSSGDVDVVFVVFVVCGRYKIRVVLLFLLYWR
jgi:hypothetical protein